MRCAPTGIGTTSAARSARLTALVAVGAFEQIAQVLLIREFFLVFKGNEVSFGAVFAFWMFWTAVGSGVFAFVADRLVRPARLFCLLALVLAASLIAEIYLVRISRGLFSVPSGAYLSVFSMAFFTFVLLSGVCFVGGALFVVGTRLWTVAGGRTDPQAPARTYVADCLGCLLGGLAVTIILVVLFDSFTSAFVSAAVLLFATAWLASAYGLGKLRLVSAGAAVVCVVLMAFGPALSRAADRAQWRTYNEQYELAETRDSKYGKLAVLTYGEQRSLFGNGELYFSVPDEIEPVHAANLALLQHPEPRDVLVVGGGLSGLLRELLRHDLRRIDYVELDPEVIALARKYLPAEDRSALDDPRVRVHHLDGRRFVARTDGRYDLVLCGVPDPSTAALNRFYTQEFFERVREILHEGGVLVTGVCAEGFWEKEQLQRIGSIYATLRSVFPKVIACPGGGLFAGDEKSEITLDAETLVEQFGARGVEVPRFVPEVFYTTLEADSIEEVNARLEDVVARSEGSAPLLNTDSAPVSYYYNLIVWNRLSETRFLDAFDWMLGVETWWFGPVLAVLLLPFGIVALVPGSRKRRRRRRRWKRRASATYSVLLLMAVTGLFGMVVEIALLYWFQNVYGYVYSVIGLLTALFMVGLAVGAGVWPQAARHATLACGIAALLFGGLLAGLSAGFFGSSSEAAFGLFLLLNFAGGFLVGAMFRMMTAAGGRLGLTPARSAGILYGADLAGACLGSLVAGSFLIPVLGMPVTLLAADGLLAAALVAHLIAMHRPVTRRNHGASHRYQGRRLP